MNHSKLEIVDPNSMRLARYLKVPNQPSEWRQRKRSELLGRFLERKKTLTNPSYIVHKADIYYIKLTT